MCYCMFMSDNDNHFQDNKIRHYFLYVLKLEDKKFYIGVTSKNPEERFLEHKNGFYGAEWTKIHKPLSIEQTVDLGITDYKKAEEYENKITRKYIQKHGLNNVRGGNITYRGEMVKRFGYIWRTEDWKDIVMLVVLLVWMAFLTFYLIYDIYAVHGGRLWV